MKRTDLEILGHHVEAGHVWDGDQISKKGRDDLIRRGLLERVDGGNTVPTRDGIATWRRWRLVYAVWERVMRLKWRWQESRRA